MISFGELRKKSVEWQMEISAVEKVYALDWVLKGVFDRPALAEALVLRGAPAMAKAYFPDYPRVDEADFVRDSSVGDTLLEGEIEKAIVEGAHASGLKFRLHNYQPTEARIEFTGPLGRRSAAQPLIVLRLTPNPPRDESARRELIHLFSDACQTTVRTLSLEELAAERFVLYSQKPRARDVFDFWFLLTRGRSKLNFERVESLAHTIALDKKVTLRSRLDPQYAALLERGWDTALKHLRERPSFAQAQVDIERAPLSSAAL